MARNVKLRKREIALGIGVGALASLAAAGILSDGFGGPGSVFTDHHAPKVAMSSASSHD